MKFLRTALPPGLSSSSSKWWARRLKDRFRELGARSSKGGANRGTAEGSSPEDDDDDAAAAAAPTSDDKEDGMVPNAECKVRRPTREFSLSPNCND